MRTGGGDEGEEAQLQALVHSLKHGAKKTCLAPFRLASGHLPLGQSPPKGGDLCAGRPLRGYEALEGVTYTFTYRAYLIKLLVLLHVSCLSECYHSGGRRRHSHFREGKNTQENQDVAEGI